VARRRGIAFVLTFIFIAMLVSFFGSVVLYFVSARGPSVAEGATLVLRPGGELVDVRPGDVVGQVLGREGVTLRTLVDTVHKARRDSRVGTLLLRPTGLDTPFWGKVQELRAAIAEFRASGKRVVAHLEYGGDREYFLASAADEVFLLPTSPLDLTGVASYEIFLRGALDKIGAYPDFLRIGPFKTAPNQFTQTGFTPAHREMMESLNRDVYDQLVSTVAEARRKSVAEVRSLLDNGPFPPEEAQRAGFVDGLAYLDELDDRVPALASASQGEGRLVEGSDYQRVSPGTVGIQTRSRIAVLYASGVIASGRSSYDVVNGAVVGSDSMVEQIRRIRDDDSIRAVVLRIDSPGGSSVASDVIWRELMISRERTPKRPLIASMSDLAASGGYYIAMPAEVIVAQPATLTGSIGVFAGKFALGGTMEKLGVGTGTITSGANADIYSPFTPFSESQRARLTESIESFYTGFIRKAATSRRTTPERIDAVAQGRVWTGQQAREQGLVDELGGLDRAVAIAKERAGIPADEDVELVVFPPRRSLYEALAEQFQAAGAGSWLQLLGGSDARALATLTVPVRLFRRGEPLALMPWAFVR
jgi:protease-4